MSRKDKKEIARLRRALGTIALCGGEMAWDWDGDACALYAISALKVRLVIEASGPPRDSRGRFIRRPVGPNQQGLFK